MKNKKLFTIVVLVVLIATLLLAPWQSKPVLASVYNQLYTSKYQANVNYEKETTPGLIGSYTVVRYDGSTRWVEKDNWNSLGALVLQTYKYTCVRFFYFQSGTFSAADGYEWRLTKSPYGDPCLKLYPTWWPKAS